MEGFLAFFVSSSMRSTTQALMGSQSRSSSGFLGIFDSKKLRNGAILNALGISFCASFSRNSVRSSSYDPQFPDVLPAILKAFLAALRYTRRVVAAYVLP